MRAIFLRSWFITTTSRAQNFAPSRFDEPRGTVRYGVIPQRTAHHATGHLTQHYDDPAYSGGNLDRPALLQLLKDVDAGQVDVIVVYKIDRLTQP
jgi:hypothetical protein